MFYDERIHAGRGKAFRKTIIFATVIFLIYAALHSAVLLTYNGKINVFSIFTESVSGLAGIIILLFGELFYSGSAKDEMLLAGKNKYYAKAFYKFLYIVAGAYCISAPIALRNAGNSYSDFPPNNLLIICEITLWLYLLLCFKKEEMPINASALYEDKREYYSYVLKNILKFGGICAVFTAVSFIVSFFAITLSGGADVFDIALILGILVSVVVSFISFSLEYLLFSVAERISDTACEKGRVSAVTKAFLITFSAVTLLSDLFFALWLTGNAPNSSATVILFSQLNGYFGYIVLYFTGLFSVYLLSEAKTSGGNNFSKYLSGFVIVNILSFLYGKFSVMALNIVAQKYSQIDYIVYEKAISIVGIINILFLLAEAFFIVKAQLSLKEKGYANTFFVCVFALGYFVSVLRIFLSNVLMRSVSGIGFYLTLAIVCAAELIIWLREIKKINEMEKTEA